MHVDLIVKSDCIFDSIQDDPFSGFIAVKGNRITAVERGDDIDRYVGDHTRIKEFGDNTVMAGFHDSHTHLIMAGLFKTYVNLASAKSEEEAVLMVKEAVEKDVNKEGWILGFSWYHVFWDNLTMPTKASLDKYFPDRPVCLLHAEAHGAWVNSKALEVLGITDKTPDPFDGIVKDDQGVPTGVLLEGAAGLVTKYAFDFKPEEEKKIIRSFMRAAKEYGITSINDVQPYYHGNMGDVGVYSSMEQDGEFTARVHVAPDLLGDLDQVLKDREKYTSDKLRIDHVKQFLDGVVTTHTSLVLEEYADEPGNFGEETYDIAGIHRAVGEAHKRGLSIKLHSCGDRSARYALDFYEEAIKMHGRNKNCRHAIEHLEMIKEEDIARLGELEVIPSVQPEHLALTQTYAANPYPKVLGKSRADKTFPYKSMLDSAGLLAMGSDCPVVDNNPFLEIYRGVTRVHNDGMPKGGWTPSEKLTLSEALKSYTYGSAYGVSREEELGSLREGNFADIIVIDKDLFKIPEAELIERKVIMTIMDGNIIYEK